MRQVIVALIPACQEERHAKVRLTIKILSYKGCLYALGISKATISHKLDILKVRRNNLGHIIRMRVKKLAHAKLA